MALTYSPTDRLGEALPSFQARTVEGHMFSSRELTIKDVVVVVFLCGHCPYVQAIEDRLIQLAQALNSHVHWVGICSNDPADDPEDQPPALLERWQKKKYSFPYLIDDDQQIAKTFGAVCTPDIFVYNQQRKLCYRGRFDDSWRDARHVQRQDLKLAIQATLSHQPLPFVASPAMGCSIKWKVA
jgi:thiol-disulfide isomerase/thioredoxin